MPAASGTVCSNFMLILQFFALYKRQDTVSHWGAQRSRVVVPFLHGGVYLAVIRQEETFYGVFLQPMAWEHIMSKIPPQFGNGVGHGF